MNSTLDESASHCPETPEHVEPIAAEMEGAFSYTRDDVKLVYRQEITQALAAARSTSQRWSTDVDDSEGVCGSISSHSLRIRRKPDVDQPPLPSIAMMEPHPVIHSPEWSFDFKVEFASFITQPETHDHVTKNLRSLTWECSRVTLPKNTSLYGTGENAGSLLLNDMLDYLPLEHSTEYDQRRFNPKRLVESNSPHILKRPRNTVVCWNTDACFYDESFESLYQSHPYVVAVLEDGRTIGLYTDSTYRTILHFCRTDKGEINVYTISDSPLGPPLLYILHGDHPELVSRELARLTGYMALPPLWALGNQQCRYSYFPDTQVKEIADSFREKKIPCDVIWMDIHYMDEYRCFTFHPTLFPDPKGLNDYLHQKGFKSVYMIDPGIKMEKGYAVYDAGVKENVFIKEESGTNHDRIGTVWPGLTAFPDFTMEKTRSWWADLFHDTSVRGVDGVWNDMNEIASFQPGSTIHPKSWHRADEIFGGPGTNARYHNVYGMLMTRSTREGMLKANPNKRPFVLTRANFVGGQRYSASWTGDNASSWDHLHWSIPMILNFGLSGQPFSGCDIGGFFDNASPDLFARWMGIGSLLPFCRAHTCLETNQHEPWSFGEETEISCRRSILRRYRLLPHFYTQFWHATRTGLPICRPLFWADPTDMDLRHADDSFLIGESVLVRAVTAQDHTVGCLSKMPKNHKWSRFYILEDDKKVIDPHAPEFYIREGSIVPLGPVMNYTNEVPLDPLTLIVCLDSHNSATGILYEDSGDGFEYAHGEYRETKYTIHLDGNNLELYSWKQDGNLPTPSRKVQVILIDSRFPVRKYEINEDELPLFIPFNH